MNDQEIFHGIDLSTAVLAKREGSDTDRRMGGNGKC